LKVQARSPPFHRGPVLPGPYLAKKIKKFREGLVFKAHRLLYHSTPGSKVMKKKEKRARPSLLFPASVRRGGATGVTCSEETAPPPRTTMGP